MLWRLSRCPISVVPIQAGALGKDRPCDPCAVEAFSIHLLNLEMSKVDPDDHCAVEQSWLPLTQFAFEKDLVRVTHCAVEASSIPIAQFGNEQRSIPMPQCGVGAKS